MNKLKQHQKEIVDKFPEKFLLAHGTGTGKTITSIELAKKVEGPTLVIVPKGVVEKWKMEILFWLGDMKVKEIDDREVHLAGDKVWTIISKEKFKSKFKKGELKARSSIICDESHHFAGLRSQLSKSLEKYIKMYEVPYVWLLTATPYLSTPWNIFQLAKYIGHNWNYWTFKKKFFYDIPMGPGGKMIPVPKKGIEDEIAKLVNAIGSTVTLDDCFDVPDQIDEVEYFKLTKEQERGVKALDKEEFNPAVKFGKKHQVENGTLKGDQVQENQFFKDYKTERIIDLCRENKKVAIFARYNLQLKQIKEALDKEKIKARVINGQVPTSERNEIIKWVEENDEAIVIINSSVSEGYELPSVGVIVFASLSFSYKDYVQGKGRFLRMNKLKKNVFIHLICKGVDEDVYKSIQKKKDFDIAIYSKENKFN